LTRQRRPEPDREVAFRDAEGLAFDIGERADAAVLAGDDGVGRLVEQHEYRFHRRRTRMIAKADQYVDIDQRQIAGARDDPRNRVRRSAGDVG